MSTAPAGRHRLLCSKANVSLCLGRRRPSGAARPGWPAVVSLVKSRSWPKQATRPVPAGSEKRSGAGRSGSIAQCEGDAAQPVAMRRCISGRIGDKCRSRCARLTTAGGDRKWATRFYAQPTPRTKASARHVRERPKSIDGARPEESHAARRVGGRRSARRPEARGDPRSRRPSPPRRPPPTPIGMWSRPLAVFALRHRGLASPTRETPRGKANVVTPHRLQTAQREM